MSLYVEIVECTSVAKSVIWTQSIYFQSMRFFAEDQIVGGETPWGKQDMKMAAVQLWQRWQVR